jgi:hypothetical protein
MPTHYEHDSEYESKNEELQDKVEATQSKLESLNKTSIMDFDDFVDKEGIGDALHSKDRK